MPNTTVTSSQSVHEGVNSMVSYKDTIFRSRGRRIFAVLLISCIIIGALAGTIYGFRDPILDLFGISIGGSSTASAGGFNQSLPEEMRIVLTADEGSTPKKEINPVHLYGGHVTYRYGIYYWLELTGTLPQSIQDSMQASGQDIVFTYYRVNDLVEHVTAESWDDKTKEDDIVKDENENPVTRVTDAGCYFVTAAIPGNDEYYGLTLGAYLHIDKADVTASSITIPENDTVYDEEKKVLSTNNIPEDAEVVGYEIVDIYETMLENGLDSLTPDEFIEGKDTLNLVYVDEIVNVGNYYVTATLDDGIDGKDNYKETKFAQSGYITVEKADIVNASLQFTNANRTYSNGQNTTVSINNLPNGVKVTYNYTVEYLEYADSSIIGESKTDSYEDVVDLDDNGNPKNTLTVSEAGKYTITSVSISGERNYNDLTLEYTEEDTENIFEIYRAAIDLSKIFFKQYTSVTYNKEKHTVKLDGINEYDTTIKVAYDVVDTVGGVCDFDNLVNAGEYIITATLYGRNYEVAVHPTKAILVINRAYLEGLTLSGLTRKYDGTDSSLTVKGTIPEGVKVVYETVVLNDSGKEVRYNSRPESEVGTYTIIATLTGDNYYDLQLSATLKINKRTFIGINVPYNQSANKNGNTVFIPEYTILDSEDKDFPEDTTVSFYIDENKNNICDSGETVTGFSKLGTYKNVIVVFSHPNYEDYTAIVKFTVKFNPLIVYFGIALGVALAILLMIFIMPAKRRKDRKSREYFINIRTQLETERGGVICESIAKTKDNFSRKKGRLYLTAKALEFYDKKYLKNYRNFVIVPKDITDIKCRGAFGGKLIILSRGGTQKIKVPAGTAKLWKKELLHFKEVEQCFHTEVHALNADQSSTVSTTKSKGKKSKK